MDGAYLASGGTKLWSFAGLARWASLPMALSWLLALLQGPIFLHGLEADVDVMIEAKCKEQALLCYRDGLPIPEGLSEVADKLHVEG